MRVGESRDRTEDVWSSITKSQKCHTLGGKKQSRNTFLQCHCRLLTEVQWTQIKDTATLWERRRHVEMAERLGQKLQRERKSKLEIILQTVGLIAGC